MFSGSCLGLTLMLILALDLSMCPVHGCGRGITRIENNGYKDILIAISDNIAENSTLIDRIKTVFTEASALLYTATRKRAYFEEITILVPASWSEGVYGLATKETFDKSDIVVDYPDSRANKGNRPFVIKTTPCGEFGYYMHLTADFFLDETIAAEFGPYDKIIVHEWSHLRYGVYDEYVSDTATTSHFYAASSGEPSAIRCSQQIGGSLVDLESGETSCNSVNGIPDSDCRFQDENLSGRTGFGSLMYKVFLNQITAYCDNDPEFPDLLHNTEAPTDQNKLCDGKSVWEVLREHEDFLNDVNPPRDIADTTPTFTVVQPKTLETVLVLDVSGSMGDDNDFTRMEALGQGCSNYISNIILDGEYLGVVWFNASAHPIANLTLIDNTTRAEMVGYVPTGPGGGTSIGSGIQAGLDMLGYSGQCNGGALIVVTDGEENSDPRISDVEQEVRDCKVTVHTIAISANADTNLDNLAVVTGGLSFVYGAGTVGSNVMNEAFMAIGELNQNPTERSYILLSSIMEVSTALSPVAGSVVIDDSLGRTTQLLFDYDGTDITPEVTSPSGTVYDVSMAAVVTHDTKFSVYRFTIPDEEFVAGTWVYSITSTDAATQRFAVTVKSKSANAGQYPILASVNWGRDHIDSIAPGQVNLVQSIYASVSQGYTPVLNAAVVATVERITAGDSVDVALLDNGAGADLFAGDGVYSAYFLGYQGKSRYGLSVAVNSNAATVISPQRIIGKPAASSVVGTETVPDIPVNNMTRSATGQSFQLANFTAGVLYAPSKIYDLSVTSVSQDNRTVTLTWTAVGDQLDQGTASSYELRVGANFTEMASDFASQTLLTDANVTDGGSLSAPQAAGNTETFTVVLDQSGTLVFAVKAISSDNCQLACPVSNLVTASLAMPDNRFRLSVATIVVLSLGGAAVLAVIVIAFVAFCVTTAERSPPATNQLPTKTAHAVQRTPSYIDMYDMRFGGYYDHGQPYANGQAIRKMGPPPSAGYAYAYDNRAVQAYQ